MCVVAFEACTACVVFWLILFSHIYAYIYMSYSRNNHVIFKMWFGPHVLLCINKKYYEHTRKKGRHFTILIRYSYDSCICLSNIIQISQKSHFTIKHVGIKKEIRIDFLHRASYISTCTDHYHHFLPLNHHPLRVLDYSLQNI